MKTQNKVLEKLSEIKNLLQFKEDNPLTIEQAAGYLGFSKSYLYKLCSKKIIPHYKPSGKILFFSKVELDNWIFNRNQNEGKIK